MGEDSGLGGTRYTTAIGQALASVAAGVALQIVTKNKLATQWPAWDLGSAFGCAILGALVYGIPQLEQYRSYHKRASFMFHCIAVPFMSTHFSIVNKYDTDLAYIQLLFPVFPLVADLINDNNKRALQDAVVGGTLLFKTFMHFQSKNYYGLAFCASYAIFHFFIGSEGSVGDVPVEDLHTIGFIFNKFFIIKALYV